MVLQPPAALLGTGSSLGWTSVNGGTCSMENTIDKKVVALPPLVKDHWTIISTDLILVFQSCFCWVEQYCCSYHSQILQTIALQRGWQKHISNFLKFSVLYQPVNILMTALGASFCLSKKGKDKFGGLMHLRDVLWSFCPKGA